MLKVVENWDKKNLRCYFCGETKSVKYSIEIFDPVLAENPTRVCVCNRCAMRQKAKEMDFKTKGRDVESDNCNH